MALFGYSTGAIALGDFRRGIELLRGIQCPAIELSALRDHELPELVKAIPELDLSMFRHISIHAPSSFRAVSETKAIELLEPIVAMGYPVVLHPDATANLQAWNHFGSRLLIENMDKRKRTGRTIGELERVFEAVPNARMCFDIAHARQVDPTMSEAWLILRRFGKIVEQVHLSEVDGHGQHTRLTVAATIAYPRVVPLISESCPVILECRAAPEEVEAELAFAASIWLRRQTGRVNMAL